MVGEPHARGHGGCHVSAGGAGTDLLARTLVWGLDRPSDTRSSQQTEDPSVERHPAETRTRRPGRTAPRGVGVGSRQGSRPVATGPDRRPRRSASAARSERVPLHLSAAPKGPRPRGLSVQTLCTAWPPTWTRSSPTETCSPHAGQRPHPTVAGDRPRARRRLRPAWMSPSRGMTSIVCDRRAEIQGSQPPFQSLRAM
jgi:hypothetical protein